MADLTKDADHLKPEEETRSEDSIDRFIKLRGNRCSGDMVDPLKTCILKGQCYGDGPRLRVGFIGRMALRDVEMEALAQHAEAPLRKHLVAKRASDADVTRSTEYQVVAK